MTTESPFDFDENVTLSWNDTERGINGTNITQVSGLNFLDSFVKALTAMLVSELGDKTFFLAGK